MLYAAAPFANKHKYILPGNVGGCIKLKEIMPKLPNVFTVLNMVETQIPELADILAENKVKTAAIIYHGIEQCDMALKEFKKKGIKIISAKSLPRHNGAAKLILLFT
jgi:hypothetical protein